ILGKIVRKAESWAQFDVTKSYFGQFSVHDKVLVCCIGIETDSIKIGQDYILTLKDPPEIEDTLYWLEELVEVGLYNRKEDIDLDSLPQIYNTSGSLPSLGIIRVRDSLAYYNYTYLLAYLYQKGVCKLSQMEDFIDAVYGGKDSQLFVNNLYNSWKNEELPVVKADLGRQLSILGYVPSKGESSLRHKNNHHVLQLSNLELLNNIKDSSVIDVLAEYTRDTNHMVVVRAIRLISENPDKQKAGSKLYNFTDSIWGEFKGNESLSSAPIGILNSCHLGLTQLEYKPAKKFAQKYFMVNQGLMHNLYKLSLKLDRNNAIDLMNSVLSNPNKPLFMLDYIVQDSLAECLPALRKACSSGIVFSVEHSKALGILAWNYYLGNSKFLEKEFKRAW